MINDFGQASTSTSFNLENKLNTLDFTLLGKTNIVQPEIKSSKEEMVAGILPEETGSLEKDFNKNEQNTTAYVQDISSKVNGTPSQRARLEYVRQVLLELMIPLSHLKGQLNTRTSYVYLGKINSILDKSFEILTPRDESIGLTLSTIKNILEPNNLNNLTTKQIDAIISTIDVIQDNANVDYYDYSYSLLKQSGANLLPQFPK